MYNFLMLLFSCRWVATDAMYYVFLLMRAGGILLIKNRCRPLRRQAQWV